ncbi:MAG: tetratricopeptide repeat protein [Bacteroidota bacterium]
MKKIARTTYAHMMLAKGSVMSGQYDKAISRLQTIIRLQPTDLEAILMLADVYERTGDKTSAVKCTRQA